MKKLPSIFKNNIDKIISNNREVYHVCECMKYSDVIKVLDSIFLGFNLPQDIPVLIKTRNSVYDTKLNFMCDDYVNSIDNQKIYIKDIIFIERKDTKF